MKNNNRIRLIPKIDIKGSNLVKGINLEGFRAFGDVNSYIEKYYNDGADELILNDVVASLYDRNTLHKLLENITKKIFIPLIVGGGIRTIKDIEFLLKSGADRVYLNSAIIKNPNFINKSVNYFGSSTIIGSIEVVKVDKKYICVSNSGREETKLNLLMWAKELEDRGVSEIFITSVDKDGLGEGFDIELLNILDKNINIPYIVSGGYGNTNHLHEIKHLQKLSGISIGSALHYFANNQFNFNLKKFSEGNYNFINENKNFLNFENKNIKKLKKIIERF